jgi:hypothetical protein
MKKNDLAKNKKVRAMVHGKKCPDCKIKDAEIIVLQTALDDRDKYWDGALESQYEEITVLHERLTQKPKVVDTCKQCESTKKEMASLEKKCQVFNKDLERPLKGYILYSEAKALWNQIIELNTNLQEIALNTNAKTTQGYSEDKLSNTLKVLKIKFTQVTGYAPQFFSDERYFHKYSEVRGKGFWELFREK